MVKEILEGVLEANKKLPQPYFSNHITKKVEEAAMAFNKEHGFGSDSSDIDDAHTDIALSKTTGTTPTRKNRRKRKSKYASSDPTGEAKEECTYRSRYTSLKYWLKTDDKKNVTDEENAKATEAEQSSQYSGSSYTDSEGGSRSKVLLRTQYSTNSSERYDQYKHAVETDPEVEQSLTKTVTEAAGAVLGFIVGVAVGIFSWFS
ncbi:hypothetical protein DPMN_017756 [Dreissena polymorpha]|uniref:Uncharacterized protein n=2 Tax=Dreissena polymorpha TaxID=45954 RepID=A0A9D4S7R7_DREPO|nr:hypothetical protein DPMN_017756 [Dreissena polymorpha]